MSSLESIEGWEYLNTSEVNDMYAMFRKCRQLPEINLTHFDTSNVTDMGSMFEYCSEVKELDVSKFKTSSVKDMSNVLRDMPQNNRRKSFRYVKHNQYGEDAELWF